jgi:phytoene dehydrogenase-like protein
MLKDKVTRREFIQLASMAAASLTLAGCMSGKFVDQFAQSGKKPGDYPVVVIGSGIGGLASAVYLSRAGFPVTVIEQHSIPGGYATAFRRGDYNFDVSLHFFSAPEQMYRELGVEGKVERIPLNMSRRVIRGGLDYTVPDASSPEFMDFISRGLSDDKDGLLKYYAYCQAVADETMRFFKNMESGSVSLPSFPQEYPRMWELREMSFSQLLDKFIRNPAVKNSMGGICGIFGIPPSQTSGFMAAVVTGSMMQGKSYYFKSRSQDLSNALAAVIRENKGTLILGKAVNKILTVDNRVTGVRTEDGMTYPARFVVSNANAPDTFEKFLSDNPEAQKHMETLAKYKPSISSFLIWLGLKGELRGKIPALGISIDSGYDTETDFKNYLACDAEKCPVNVALYDNYYKGYSKPGTSTLTIMILSGYEPWRRFEKDYFAGNKKEYNREKERIARILIRRVEEKAIPGLSSMIQVREAATPLTNITFTRNPEGAIYGYPSSVDNAYMNRVKNTTPIKGLFLSSGWGSNSGSYAGGIMNGREVYRLIMKDI